VPPVPAPVSAPALEPPLAAAAPEASDAVPEPARPAAAGVDASPHPGSPAAKRPRIHNECANALAGFATSVGASNTGNRIIKIGPRASGTRTGRRGGREPISDPQNRL
jgi:hypothetical protein